MLSSFFSLLLICNIITAGEFSYFVDEQGKRLKDLDFITERLEPFFDIVTDVPITVKLHDEPTSWFNYIETSVIISNRATTNVVKYHNTIAHEATHLALYRLTSGANIQDNFRFFDEGFASIMGESIVGNNDSYYKMALNTARTYLESSNLNLSKVADWETFFGGDDSDAFNWYAYRVGSSFIYFIEDTWGKERLRLFFIDIGKTKKLHQTIENIFGCGVVKFETMWFEYIKNNSSNLKPQVVNSFPENYAVDVSTKVKEIYVEFSMPMREIISLITHCSTGICYTDAYWKTDRVLAIKIPNSLKPNHEYVIQLGFKEFSSQLESTDGTPFPIASWSFRTGN